MDLGQEVLSRRAAAWSRMNSALTAAREEFKRRHAVHGLSKDSMDRGWRAFRKELLAKWEGIITRGVQQFERDFAAAYTAVMRGAACTCCGRMCA